MQLSDVCSYFLEQISLFGSRPSGHSEMEFTHCVELISQVNLLFYLSGEQESLQQQTIQQHIQKGITQFAQLNMLERMANSYYNFLIEVSKTQPINFNRLLSETIYINTQLLNNKTPIDNFEFDYRLAELRLLTAMAEMKKDKLIISQQLLDRLLNVITLYQKKITLTGLLPEDKPSQAYPYLLEQFQLLTSEANVDYNEFKILLTNCIILGNPRQSTNKQQIVSLKQKTQDGVHFLTDTGQAVYHNLKNLSKGNFGF